MEVTNTAKEFGVGFWELNGSIDEETAKAIFRGDFDITASQSDNNKMSKRFSHICLLAGFMLHFA